MNKKTFKIYDTFVWFGNDASYVRKKDMVGQISDHFQKKIHGNVASYINFEWPTHLNQST